jgi:hypothetical protein
MSSTEWQAVLAMQVTQDRNHIQAAAPVTLFQYGGYEVLTPSPRIPPSKRSRPDDSYEIGTLLAALERAAATEREMG